MSSLDWTSLQPDIVERIGSMVIADDLTDFIRLRAVCHPWRSATEEARRRADFLCPRNWITLSNHRRYPTEPWYFYNTSTNKSFWFDLNPFLKGYSKSFYPSIPAFGCLFLLKKEGSDQGFALLNPFMRSITQLPSKVEYKREGPILSKVFIGFIEAFYQTQRFEVHVTSSSTIVLWFPFFHCLLWTKKPGDESWVYAEFSVFYCSNMLFYEDQILAIVDEALVQINLDDEIPPQLELEVVIPATKLPGSDNDCCLVVCDGDIMLFTVKPHYTHYDVHESHLREPFDIYKVDLKEKMYAHTINPQGNCFIFRDVYDYGDKALWITCKSLCLGTENFLILCDGRNRNTIFYNVSTNWVRRVYNYNGSVHPHCDHPFELIKDLVKYCKREHLMIMAEDE